MVLQHHRGFIGEVLQLIAHLVTRFTPICAEVLHEMKRAMRFAGLVRHARRSEHSDVMRGPVGGAFLSLDNVDRSEAHEQDDDHEQRPRSRTHAQGGRHLFKRGLLSP